MKRENFILPSPADLVKKEATVNISLRVKQSTVDIFDMLAKQNQTKTGTMMISLLDMYADNYRKENQDDSKTLVSEVAKTYINKIADKVGKLDNSKIILKICQDASLLDEIREYSDYEDMNAGIIEAIIDDYKHGKVEEFENLTSLFGSMGCYTLDLCLIKDDEEIRLEAGDHIKGDVYEDFLYLPADKWLITTYMLWCYKNKAYDIFQNYEILLTEEMGHKIFELAKKTKDRAIYAKKLSKILIDFIEEQSD